MNLATAIILLLVIAAVLAAVLSLRKHSGGCDGCNGCSACGDKTCQRRK
jgi:hypothetical protein